LTQEAHLSTQYLRAQTNGAGLPSAQNKPPATLSKKQMLAFLDQQIASLKASNEWSTRDAINLLNPLNLFPLHQRAIETAITLPSQLASRKATREQLEKLESIRAQLQNDKLETAEAMTQFRQVLEVYSPRVK